MSVRDTIRCYDGDYTLISLIFVSSKHRDHLFRFVALQHGLEPPTPINQLFHNRIIQTRCRQRDA